MPIDNYGVLKGVADRAQREPDGKSPHYQVRVVNGGQRWRLAINVKSSAPTTSQPEASEVLYFIDADFNHALLPSLKALGSGFTRLRNAGDGPALDFIRSNLFDPTMMRHLPPDKPGAENDLQDMVELHVAAAMRQNATCYAFGAAWMPGGSRRDADEAFDTDQGVHDIHMNQGNSGRFKKDNGVFQDGALLLHFGASDRWVGIFLAFQSQAWHTDDRTGNPLPGTGGVVIPERTERARIEIVGALVNPRGDDAGLESVTLLNTSDQSVSLDRWSIIDKQDKAEALSGQIGAGEARRFILSGKGAQLANAGGLITLLDPAGLKVDGVSFVKAEAAEQGRTLTFRR